MIKKLSFILFTLILSGGICLADNYIGGIHLTSVHSGTVSGGVYCDSYYGTGTQAIHTAKTIDKTFTLPANAQVEWAMLFTTVYCGNMQNNYQGTANVSFNGKTLGNETLKVPFAFIPDGGTGFVQVNDHVNRVTSDYMIYYNVTSLAKPGENIALVHTEPADSSFDGRVKLITLIAAYNDGSGKKIWYQINQGHDVDSYYSDDNLGENYIGSTTFQASLPAGSSLTDAKLTDVHLASTDGIYTFNGNILTSGTPQGSYSGSDSWDIKSSFSTAGTNTLSYDRNAPFYKNVLGVLTAEYTESQVSAPVADFKANRTSGTIPLSLEFTDQSTGVPSSWTWDFGDGTTATGQTVSHTYTSAGTYSVKLTVANAGGSNSTLKTNYITASAPSTNDLSITGVVNTVPGSAVFAREANTVTTNVMNSGNAALNDISVALYASDVSSTVPVNTTTIASLASGGTAAVTLIDPTIRSLEGGNVTYTAVVDQNNLITETNETNNNKSSSVKPVKYNGYKGKRYWTGSSDITTRKTFDIHGNMIYFTQPSSSYSARGWTDRTETWAANNLPIPDGATVERALLYTAYCWDLTPGGVPNWTATFNGHALTNGSLYTDKSNFGSYADNSYGLYSYDVTSQFNSNGNSLTMTSGSGNSNALYPSTLVVIYKNPSKTRKQIFINEECDELGYSESKYGTSINEATAYAPFTGMSVDTSKPMNAHLHSFVGSAGPNEGNLYFNGKTVASNAWQGDASTVSVLTFDVKSLINSDGNEAGIQATDDGGMNAQQQILVIEYQESAPVANFTAVPTSGNSPLTVQFTDASTGTISGYVWDFGDGNNSTRQNPEHTYSTPGTYNVNLTVISLNGNDSEVKTGYIVVKEPLSEAPVAAFAAVPTSGDVPLTVKFTDQSTGTPTSWFWDFGDGNNTTGQNVTHIYTSAGTYIASLTVSNANGTNSTSSSITVTEKNSQVLPIANFSANTSEGYAPLAVQFTNMSENTVSLIWDFGDGVNSTEQNPVHIYSEAGDYTVNLTVSNENGTDSKFATISVFEKSAPVLPLANFSCNVIEGYAPLSVQFTDLSENATGISWDYGDGTNSTEKNPLHTYSTVGNYTVNLTVSNGNGTASMSTAINVLKQPAVLPDANFSSDVTTGAAPLSVQFTDLSKDAISWNWDFGDGAKSTEQNPLHTYNVSGTFTVTLTASNEAGIDNVTKTGFINVTSVSSKLAATFTASPIRGNFPLKVVFTDKSTGSPTSWKWSFGDGTYSTESNPVHIYNKAGKYTVRLTVNNSKDSSSVTKKSFISVTNYLKPPVAAFSASPTSGNVPLKVAFTDKSKGSPSSWKWSFGDGTYSSDRNPVHTYSKAGKYTVSLTVKNRVGKCTITGFNYIKVTDSLKPPVAAFSASPTSGKTPLKVNFVDKSSGAPTSWKWSFGDGKYSTARNPSHIYTKAGKYTVTLTAKNARGSSTKNIYGYITVSKK